MSELLPCPFCGSHAQTDFIEGVSYIIECYGCEARTDYHGDAESAIAAWNRRASPVQAEPVKRHTVRELLALYDKHNGDWCAVARAVEDRFAHPPSGKDAERLNWLKANYYGANFDFDGDGTCVIAFKIPKGTRVSADLEATIDAAMTAEGRKG